MRKSNAYPYMAKMDRWSLFAIALFLAIASLPVVAQQHPSSGTTERFEPVFDVGYAMRPRAGIFGITELMIAALEADIAKAQQLIDAGADVNETDDSQSTPLMWAVHSGDVDTVNFFISQGADVRAKAYQGATAAINAISGKQEAIAIILFDAGADANGRGNSRQNFLEASAESGMTGAVEALIRNGTDLDTYGPSALLYAVSRGHTDAVNVLLDAGVDVNAQITRSQNSILHTASATGDLDLVTLLLSRGAEVSQSADYKSPMYPAVSRGYTTIVELLIANGATVSAQYLLSAAQNGYADTAITLSQHLNLETLEKNEIERLLAAAENVDRQEFTQLLLNSPSVKRVRDDAIRSVEEERLASLREHSRLLFARQVEDHCVIGVWDSRSDDSTELTRIDKCPDAIFASKDAETAFIVDDAAIEIIATDGSAAKLNVALPNLDYRVWVEQMAVRPDQNSDYLPAIAQMKPIGIGRLEDGSLGLLVSLWMPADDEFHYLFRHVNGQWSFEDERWCDRWGCENPIDVLAFNTTNVWAWPESRMVWHPNVSLNPFFSDQSVEMVDLQYESYQGAMHHRKFEIDGVSSVLTAYTRPSEHSNTNHTLGIELTIEDNPAKNLSGNQCLTSVVGRFILVYEFFGGRFEVTDIGTGETMIDNIKVAMWLE